MSIEEQWQLSRGAAERYERELMPAVTALWASDLIERAAPQPGEQVLDLACGTGIVARLAAEQVGGSRVVGLDVNAGMLAVARSLPTNASRAIEWREGSALALPFSDGSFDLVFCQLGLQFFTDKRAALREVWRVLTRTGRVALSVFTSIENTPAAKALAEALDRHLGEGGSRSKRSEHALANAGELHELVTGAGFRKLEIAVVTQTIRFPSVGEYVRAQFSATPLSALLTEMGSAEHLATLDQITDDLIASLGIASKDAELRFPQEAHVILAYK